MIQGVCKFYLFFIAEIVLPLLLLISLGAEEVEEDEAGTRVTSRGKNVQQIAIGGQPREAFLNLSTNKIQACLLQQVLMFQIQDCVLNLSRAQI